MIFALKICLIFMNMCLLEKMFVVNNQFFDHEIIDIVWWLG